MVSLSVLGGEAVCVLRLDDPLLLCSRAVELLQRVVLVDDELHRVQAPRHVGADGFDGVAVVALAGLFRRRRPMSVASLWPKGVEFWATSSCSKR